MEVSPKNKGAPPPANPVPASADVKSALPLSATIIGTGGVLMTDPELSDKTVSYAVALSNTRTGTLAGVDEPDLKSTPTDIKNTAVIGAGAVVTQVRTPRSTRSLIWWSVAD